MWCDCYGDRLSRYANSEFVKPNCQSDTAAASVYLFIGILPFRLRIELSFFFRFGLAE